MRKLLIALCLIMAGCASDYKNEGKTAFRAGVTLEQNPYLNANDCARYWRQGWLEGKAESMEKQ